MTRINPRKFAKFAYSWHSRSKPAGLSSDFEKTIHGTGFLAPPFNRYRPHGKGNAMKHILPLAASMLFLILSACISADLSTAQMTSAIQTLTATVLPPTVTPTPDPDESAIVLLLNSGLEKNADPLSQTVDARYQVIDASFPSDLSNNASTFVIEVRCECINGVCCTAERTFVVFVQALQTVAEKVARQIPLTVTNMQVSCRDHTAPLGAILVSWDDMADYLNGEINGFQLGGRTIKLGP
ncbi:MAG: hypothetical protein HFACDABA_02900 [Anaerolineales bacterium]|nr:hypothetical protein [Anaerolineales bacterium]